jgi:hypothetical protein
MAVTRAEGIASPAPEPAPHATPWDSLDRRQVGEMILPGALIGLLGGMISGGLAALGGLSLGVTLVSAFSLGIPLALVGATYEILLAKGRIPLGPLAPAAAVWLVGFPVSRSLNAALTDLYAGSSVSVPNGWGAFVVYQVLLSVAFAIGFWWLHENFAPRWWYALRDSNPVASHFVRVQLAAAASRETEREQREQRERGRRGQRPAADATAGRRSRRRGG